MTRSQFLKNSPRTTRLNVNQGTLLPGQIPNSCGAAAFPTDWKTQLDRILIIGTTANNFYISSSAASSDAQDFLTHLFSQNTTKEIQREALERIVEVSDKALAPNNEYAIFAFTMATLPTSKVSLYALTLFNKVIRTGTHLFSFMAYRRSYAGFGRAVKRTIMFWYYEQGYESARFQVCKYAQRNGWSHRDVLRIVRPKNVPPEFNKLFNFIVTGNISDDPYIKNFVEIKDPETDQPKTIQLIRESRFPLEMVPTEKQEREVLNSVLPNLGMNAITRNLNSFTRKGVLSLDGCKNTDFICDRLTNREAIESSRIHPLEILKAFWNYAGIKGIHFDGKISNSRFDYRQPLQSAPMFNRNIANALLRAFQLAYKNVRYTNKRILIGLDISASMNCPIYVPDKSGNYDVNSRSIPCMLAEAAIASLFCNNSNSDVVYFSERCIPSTFIEPTLTGIYSDINKYSFGSTNIASAIDYAIDRKVKYDGILIITDNETNSFAAVQPSAALNRYKNRVNTNARLLVAALALNNFSVCDPKDKSSLDIAGFSSALYDIAVKFFEHEI